MSSLVPSPLLTLAPSIGSIIPCCSFLLRAADFLLASALELVSVPGVMVDLGGAVEGSCCGEKSWNPRQGDDPPSRAKEPMIP